MTRTWQPRKEKLFNDYMDLKHELGRRPSYLELHLLGASDSPQYKQEFNTYVGFLKWAEELTEQEIEVFNRYEDWLVEAEKTGRAKSYIMVILIGMLERGISNWFKPITSREISPFFHHYLMSKEHRKRIDFSDKSSKKLWVYDEKGVSNLITTMPMTKWSGSSKGLITYKNDQFILNFDVENSDQEILF